MSESMSKKIREAITKKLREEEYIFEGIENSPSKTLDEFFQENDREDYIWEEDFEDALYSEDDELNESQGDRSKSYEVGDIIMTQRFQSKGAYFKSPHRVLIITSKKTSGGITQYEGFLLSSKIEKSNKKGSYPNNIYIRNYSDILLRGKSYDKEAFIRVDDIVRFDSQDLDISGSWKGKVAREFFEFVKTCRRNYEKGIDNSKNYWE